MKTLPQVTATAEQLPIISQNRLGAEVICGAAGSGKTSTALLRLRSLCYLFANRRERQGSTAPIRILVLTFNRTLAGYVRSLAEHQIKDGNNVELTIETFSKWAMINLGRPNVHEGARAEMRRLATGVGALTPDYIVKEVEYLLGRFEPENLERYISTERTGRGALPRIERSLRRKILDEVVMPYKLWLTTQQSYDWNDIAIRMSREISSLSYDVAIIDESQDFSANQLRAVRHHLASEFAATFVIDTVQRIYARGFNWTEVGFDVRPERLHTLRSNHRNTVQIATFASGILNGISVEGDGALPNLRSALTNGPLPIVLRGRYQNQIDWTVGFIQRYVDLNRESVAFLKPQAGRWFDYIKTILRSNSITFVDITRESDWPEGSENVALCTFHSAKGLEFDYVFILGFNGENTPYDEEIVDDQVIVLRKLLAVAVARARKVVVIGYKPGEESRLINYFSPGSFQLVDL